MTFYKKLKQKKWFRILGNSYMIILLTFSIWMLFFDSNSWLIHEELDKEIEKLEGNKHYFKKEITGDREQISKLEDPVALERFAREEYLMKKEGEEVFIIEYEDSLKTETNE